MSLDNAVNFDETSQDATNLCSSGAIMPVYTFIDEHGNVQTIREYTLVQNSSSEVKWSSGYYVVGADYNGDGVIDGRDAIEGAETMFKINNVVDVDGDVVLIITDGFGLTVDASDHRTRAGIEVTGTKNSFTIYSQKDGTGELTVKGGKYGAGIGGGNNEATANITINGCVVNATGKEGGAGIGGGDCGLAFAITINGGTVTATGDDGGAGIGGGDQREGFGITINGGTVTAIGDDGGAGIGGGTGKNGRNIAINGGDVTANAGDNATSIGGGKKAKGSNITVKTNLIVKKGTGNPPSVEVHNDGGDLSKLLQGNRFATVKPKTAAAPKVSFVDEKGETQTITYYSLVADGNSEVKWTSGYYVVGADYNGDGVIDAKDSAVEGAKTSFTINNVADVIGDVKLIIADGFSLLVDATNCKTRAGIELTGTGNSFTLYAQENGTGELTAKGGLKGAGIGGDNREKSANITINGCVVNAYGNDGGAGIGGGNRGAGSAIIINGGTVNANGASGGAGIGGGNRGTGSAITINGGTVIANGFSGGAGIGGGNKKDGYNITINGGIVTANGDNGELYDYHGGAGIGGGDEGSGKYITINGGVVTAIGDSSAAGIGGGDCYSGHDITINGGAVTAIGGVGGAGIGGGDWNHAEKIYINGGTVTAIAGNEGDSIGGGGRRNGKKIYVNTNLVALKGNTYPPTTVIKQSGGDIAKEFNGFAYALIAPKGPSIVISSLEIADTDADYSNITILNDGTLSVTDNATVTSDTLTLTDGGTLINNGCVLVNTLIVNGSGNSVRGENLLTANRIKVSNGAELILSKDQYDQLMLTGGFISEGALDIETSKGNMLNTQDIDILMEKDCVCSVNFQQDLINIHKLNVKNTKETSISFLDGFGTEQSDTIRFYRNTDVVFGADGQEINLMKGKNTVRIDKEAVVTIKSSLTNVSTVMSASWSEAVFNDIEFAMDRNASLVAKGSVFTAANIVGSSLKTTISTGTGTWFSASEIDLCGGSDQIFTGVNSVFNTGNIHGAETIKLGRFSGTVVENIEGVHKLSVGEDSLLFANDVTGTDSNDSFNFGSYDDVELDSIEFGVGNDMLKIGCYSEAVIRELDFGEGTKDSLSIGKGATLNVNKLDVDSLDKLTMGKDSTLAIADFDSFKAAQEKWFNYRDQIVQLA